MPRSPKVSILLLYTNRGLPSIDSVHMLRTLTVTCVVREPPGPGHRAPQTLGSRRWCQSRSSANRFRPIGSLSLAAGAIALVCQRPSESFVNFCQSPAMPGRTYLPPGPPSCSSCPSWSTAVYALGCLESGPAQWLCAPQGACRRTLSTASPRPKEGQPSKDGSHSTLPVDSTSRANGNDNNDAIFLNSVYHS